MTEAPSVSTNASGVGSSRETWRNEAALDGWDFLPMYHRNDEVWPAFEIPTDRGSMGPADVIAAPPGPERDKAIDAWCVSVWTPWQSNRRTIAELLEKHEVIPA